jgi:hypothetical protein
MCGAAALIGLVFGVAADASLLAARSAFGSCGGNSAVREAGLILLLGPTKYKSFYPCASCTIPPDWQYHNQLSASLALIVIALVIVIAASAIGHLRLSGSPSGGRPNTVKLLSLALSFVSAVFFLAALGLVAKADTQCKLCESGISSRSRSYSTCLPEGSSGLGIIAGVTGAGSFILLILSGRNTGTAAGAPVTGFAMSPQLAAPGGVSTAYINPMAADMRKEQLMRQAPTGCPVPQPAYLAQKPTGYPQQPMGGTPAFAGPRY